MLPKMFEELFSFHIVRDSSVKSDVASWRLNSKPSFRVTLGLSMSSSRLPSWKLTPGLPQSSQSTSFHHAWFSSIHVCHLKPSLLRNVTIARSAPATYADARIDSGRLSQIFDRLDTIEFVLQVPFPIPHVNRALEIDPESITHSKKPRQAKCHVG